MLTDQDIQKIVIANKEIFATKEDLKSFATKEDLDKKSAVLLKEIFLTKDELNKKIDSLNEKFDNILTSIDSYAKKSDTYFQEMLLLASKVDRQEKWIHQIAEKIGVQLKY